MNYIKHLAGFFDKVAADERLNPTHISMYVSLFQFWNACRFQNPISISRNELMKVSKISSKATYHKCMRELHEFGYLSYKPSYNPFKGSLVFLFDFQAGVRQLLGNNHANNNTAPVQPQEPYTNYSNSYISNKSKDKEQASTKLSENQLMEPLKEKEKLRQKKKKLDYTFLPPNLPEVYTYFIERQYPAREAEKFFNYFQSNGWLVGGRSPMKDWKAAARNWMLNALHYEPSKNKKLNPDHLHTANVKNYHEPL